MIDEEEKIIEECNNLTTEITIGFDDISNTLHKIDIANEWGAVFHKLADPVERFISNMNSIKSILKHLEGSELSNDFINGVLFVGIFSAYEGLIHEMFEIYCEMKNISADAQKKITALDNEAKDLLQFFLKKHRNKPLAESLTEITLHDPYRISCLSALFGIKTPTLDKENYDLMWEKRNIFAHHAGTKKGETISIDSHYVFLVHEKFLQLIDGYIDAFTNFSDSYSCK